MAILNLTNQTNVLNNCQLFRTLATNQLLVRKDFLNRLSPAQLKRLYNSEKDPVLNELYDIYKGLDTFFEKIREE